MNTKVTHIYRQASGNIVLYSCLLRHLTVPLHPQQKTKKHKMYTYNKDIDLLTYMVKYLCTCMYSCVN